MSGSLQNWHFEEIHGLSPCLYLRQKMNFACLKRQKRNKKQNSYTGISEQWVIRAEFDLVLRCCVIPWSQEGSKVTNS